MALSRTNGSGWGSGDTFTAAQANGMDIMITNALDKRSGQTDTLQSAVTSSGAGRITDSYVTGAGTDTTYAIGGGNSLINAAPATISGSNVTYTFSATGAVAGDKIEIRGHGTKPVLIKDGPSSTVIATLYPKSGTPKGVCHIRFDGTNWYVWRLSGNEQFVRSAQFLPEYHGHSSSAFGASSYFATATAYSGAPAIDLTRPPMITLSATDTYNWSIQTLGPKQLIDGRTLSQIDVMLAGTAIITGSTLGIVELLRYSSTDTSTTPALVSMFSSAALLTGAGSSTPAKYTATPNQNNVIDLSTYSYLLIVGGGASAGGVTFTHV